MKAREKLYPSLLFLCAAASALIVFLVGFFVFWEGYPVLARTGFFTFLLGERWLPREGIFGILPMVLGTAAVTLFSLLVGVPLGLATAIFLAELAPPAVALWARRAVELLAGIPSVVYGLFGMTVVVPFVRFLAGELWGASLAPEMKTGFSVLSAALVLAVMILPTVVSISEDALRSVPREYLEGSLALGATRWQTIVYCLLPAARPGILAGVGLGMGRAVGETMAVLMVAGNAPVIPRSLFSPVRTLSGNIGLEMAYASGEHAQALFATGVVLFLAIMILNTVSLLCARRWRGA